MAYQYDMIFLSKKMAVVITIILSMMTLLSCTKESTHNGSQSDSFEVAALSTMEGYPKIGDYGTKQIVSLSLTSEQIEQINNQNYPKPFDQKIEEDKYSIQFLGDSNLNPYRVVIIANGRVITEGAVDIKFAGILEKIKADYTDRPTPQLYREEDDYSYNGFQEAMFVMTSEPFSFSSLSSNETYKIKIQLTRKDNIRLENVEIQIWQGLGSKKSDYSLYKLFLVLFVGGFVAYRMVFGVRK